MSWWKKLFEDTGYTRVGKDGKPTNGICEKDPNKKCPYRWNISGNGVVHVEAKSLMGCCRTQDQMKAIDKLIKKNGGKLKI